jgi:hypothetical protein
MRTYFADQSVALFFESPVSWNFHGSLPFDEPNSTLRDSQTLSELNPDIFVDFCFRTLEPPGPLSTPGKPMNLCVLGPLRGKNDTLYVEKFDFAFMPALGYSMDMDT